MDERDGVDFRMISLIECSLIDQLSPVLVTPDLERERTLRRRSFTFRSVEQHSDKLQTSYCAGTRTSDRNLSISANDHSQCFQTSRNSKVAMHLVDSLQYNCISTDSKISLCLPSIIGIRPMIFWNDLFSLEFKLTS